MTPMTDPAREEVGARSIASLTKLEKKWLSRRECAWCDHILSKPGCSAIWHGCTVEEQDQRRAAALATYRPRTPTNGGTGA